MATNPHEIKPGPLKDKKKYDLKFSILVPVFNGAGTISETIKSILSQTFDNFELIVQDNDSGDNTANIVLSINDPRIKYFKNPGNLGYSRNLMEGKKNCKGDILYLMAADDILLPDALLKTYLAFKSDEQIGAVTRPYFIFLGDTSHPIRTTLILNPDKDEVVHITDDFWRVRHVLDNLVLGQLSGLAFRMKYMDKDFGEEPWISHGYPMADIFKKHPVVFLKDYQIAARLGENTTRQKSSLYDKSPTLRWINMFENVFSEQEFADVRKKCIQEIIAVNYVGLIQIKNFGNISNLIKEIFCLIKNRWTNIFSPSFWFFSLGTILTPSSLLLPLCDWYKKTLSAEMIKRSSIK